MSTLFMYCQLEDPKGDHDVQIVKGKDQFTIDGGDPLDKTAEVELECVGNDHPDIPDRMRVKIKDSDHMVGYLSAVDSKMIVPFYKAGQNDLFDVKINDLNSELSGSEGIKIRIGIKQLSLPKGDGGTTRG